MLVSIAGGTMNDAKNIVTSLTYAFTGKVEPASAMIHLVCRRGVAQ